MNVPLNPYGPHSPDYTRQVGETFAAAVRVLNHATAGRSGLVYPADVYDLLGCLMAGTAGLDQAGRQLAQFLVVQLQARRLAVPAGRYAGKPDAVVAAACGHLNTARVAARQLADALRELSRPSATSPPRPPMLQALTRAESPPFVDTGAERQSPARPWP